MLSEAELHEAYFHMAARSAISFCQDRFEPKSTSGVKGKQAASDLKTLNN